MRYLLFYMMGLLLCYLPVGAQTPQEVLQRVEQHAYEAGGMEIRFTLHASGGRMPGTLRLKGVMFRLDTEAGITWFDGTTQWTYLSQSEEVNISEPSAEELQALNPYAWLSLYRNGYALKFKEDALKEAPHYELVLTATRRTQDVLCLILYVRKSDCALQRINFVRRGGETAVITVNACKEQQTWPDSDFTFNPREYPHAEIIDLR